jgi:hypothetical protein
LSIESTLIIDDPDGSLKLIKFEVRAKDNIEEIAKNTLVKIAEIFFFEEKRSAIITTKAPITREISGDSNNMSFKVII